MDEKRVSEFNEVNSLLEKRLFEYDEIIERIRRSIKRLGVLQEPPTDVNKQSLSQPTNGDAPPELHRLADLLGKLNKNNSYLLNLAENFERLV